MKTYPEKNDYLVVTHLDGEDYKGGITLKVIRTARCVNDDRGSFYTCRDVEGNDVVVNNDDSYRLIKISSVVLGVKTCKTKLYKRKT